MKAFDSFFLMSSEDVKLYAVEVLKKFRSDEETGSIEIGDGNINFVFKVWSKEDGHSVIVKQADKFLRSSGRPLDLYRNKIEAKILQLEGELAPGFVPEVYFYDEVMAATSMEDVSAYSNLRKELMADRIYPHIAENMAEFMARTLLPTTDLVLDSAEKKQNVRFFINPELCDITEDLVLSEPYMSVPYYERNKNIIFPGNEAFVEENLYRNEALQCEVAKLRVHFMNCAQALLHGDLHSGSIFANETGLKVLDPEFAFYGPMGYDIGNVIGNLFFSLANKVYTSPANKAPIEALMNEIEKLYDLTRRKLEDVYDEKVHFQLYRVPSFKVSYIDGVMADSIGYAGTEIIRRTVGDSKVMEITSVKDSDIRIPMERALIRLGIEFIMKRCDISSGKEIIEIFSDIIR